MQAKIMLLPGDDLGEKLCGWAEQLLCEIAVAYQHRFVMVRDKIGDRSRAVWGAPLTEETVEQCRLCTGIFCGNAAAEGVNELCSMLGFTLKTRLLTPPRPLRQNARKAYLAQVTDQSPAALNKAVRMAMEKAVQGRIPLYHVAPSGKNRYAWESAVKVTGESFPGVSVRQLTAEGAMSLMLEAPDSVGMLLCPTYAGGFFAAAAAAKANPSGFLRDEALGRGNGLHAPVQPAFYSDVQAVNPLGAALAAADLLRNTLHLEDEADCLECAVENVIAGGFVTDGMNTQGKRRTADEMINMVVEQIELAGSFMH